MPVSFDDIQIGGDYTRPQLAALWGYASYEAISRGIVTPAGTPYIILFITRDKQSCHPQYEDILDGGVLRMEGETSHVTDDRLVNARLKGDEIHLFYRDRHHTPFRYQGQMSLRGYQILTKQPSQFVLVPPNP